MSYIVEIPYANDITKPMNMVELDQCIDPEYIAVCTRDNKGSFIVVKKRSNIIHLQSQFKAAFIGDHTYSTPLQRASKASIMNWSIYS